PILVTKLSRNQFKSCGMRQIDIARSERRAEPFGHGLGLVESSHGTSTAGEGLSGLALPTRRQSEDQVTGLYRCFHHPILGASSRQHQPPATLLHRGMLVKREA